MTGLRAIRDSVRGRQKNRRTTLTRITTLESDGCQILQSLRLPQNDIFSSPSLPKILLGDHFPQC